MHEVFSFRCYVGRKKMSKVDGRADGENECWSLSALLAREGPQRERLRRLWRPVKQGGAGSSQSG